MGFYHVEEISYLKDISDIDLYEYASKSVRNCYNLNNNVVNKLEYFSVKYNSLRWECEVQSKVGPTQRINIVYMKRYMN